MKVEEISMPTMIQPKNPNQNNGFSARAKTWTYNTWKKRQPSLTRKTFEIGKFSDRDL